MKLPMSAAVLVAGLAAVATGIHVAAAPPQTTAVPVRVTFADDPAHKIASDLLGPYQNGAGVSATIDPSRNGELIFYGVKSGKIAARRFRLTFDDCIGTCYDVPFVSSLTGAQIIAGIRQPNGASQPGGMLTMPVGATNYRTGIKIYIGSINSVQWTLCQTPGDTTSFCANSHSSTPANILRTAAASWTIWADPGPDPGPGVPDLREGGELITEVESGRSSVITSQGTYATPFSMTVQCVNVANCQ